VEVFKCFAGEVRAKGHRLRFHQVLLDARLLKETRPHVSGLFPTEYKTAGKTEEQDIRLDRKEAQILKKIEALHRRAARSDKTLRWLSEACRHQFDSGAYHCTEKPPQWHSVALGRAYAGIVAEAKRRYFLERYFRANLEDNWTELAGDDGRVTYRKTRLSADYFEVSELLKFADDLRGKACSVEDLEHLQQGRVARMAKKEGFHILRQRFEKAIVERVVATLREKKIHCATDGRNIYGEDPEALEAAFVWAVDDLLHVDITQRDKPILTPLYIDRLRKLKAKKEGIELDEVPRVKAKYWKAPEWTPKRKTSASDCQVLTSVEEAKDFYGVDPEAEEAESVTLYEARRQIEQQGSIRASNATEAYWQLEEMGHALPIEPTRQEWELTDKGKQCLLDSQISPEPSIEAA